jgi:hypothetical protein
MPLNSFIMESPNPFGHSLSIRSCFRVLILLMKSSWSWLRSLLYWSQYKGLQLSCHVSGWTWIITTVALKLCMARGTMSRAWKVIFIVLLAISTVIDGFYHSCFTYAILCWCWCPKKGTDPAKLHRFCLKKEMESSLQNVALNIQTRMMENVRKHNNKENFPTCSTAIS